MFINPIPNSYVTSDYANRTHPITGQRQFHPALDLSTFDKENVPVLAAADGVVCEIWQDHKSYGTTMIIRHHIDGQVYETLYAHLVRRSNKFIVGQTVKQGDRIATMGNTGQSTAAHLHFEVHKGRWNGSRTNAVNPRNYTNYYTKAEVIEMEEQIKKITQQLKDQTAAIQNQQKLITNLGAALEMQQNTINELSKQQTYNKNDAPSDYAKALIAEAQSLGITDGTYPKRPATREEVGVMQVRTFHIVEKRTEQIAKQLTEQIKKELNTAKA